MDIYRVNQLKELLVDQLNLKVTAHLKVVKMSGGAIQENWLIQDKPIEDNKTYKVAFSDYLLKGLDIPILSSKEPEVLEVYQPKNDELAIDIRKAVVAYLKSM